MRDEQQAAVYGWEDSWADWNRATATKAALRKTIRRAERWYRVRPVTAIWFPKRNRGATPDRRTMGKGRKLSTWYDPNVHDIWIRPRHRNHATTLHEVAHSICDTLFGDAPLQIHGPIWLSIYLNLLIAHKVAPRTALLASAREAGLKWAPLGKTHPHRIRRSYRAMVRRAMESVKSS